LATLDLRQSLINSTLRKVLKRLRYPLEVMLTCVRWYVAYPLRLRHIEETMQERGVFADHVTVHRWAIKVLPVFGACHQADPPTNAGFQIFLERTNHDRRN
jgi:putative transposase